jgi:APA family basic amino acid/polyamine antiporter
MQLRPLLRRLFAVQPLDRIRPDEEGKPKLRRALGLWGLIGIGLGTMLGGIFPTAGAGAQLAGSGAITGFIFSGVACIFVALCYAEFASMVPVAGSAYTYAYATLGEVIAWIIGWDLLLEYGISAAPVAASFSGYFQEFLSYFHVSLPAWAQSGQIDWSHLGSSHIDIVAALTVLVVSGLLALGIKESAGTNATFVVIQVITFVIFTIACIGFMHPSHFAGFAPLGFHSVIQASALVFFAYIGFDTVTVASEEAKNPQVDVPLAVVGSLAIGAVIFIALEAMTIGVVPIDKINPDSAMSQAVRMAGDNPFFLVSVTIGALAGNISVMITSLLGQARIFYVMSRDRMLPPSVAEIHPRFLTPARTTMITGVAVAIFALVFPLDQLLFMVNVGTLWAFAIVSLGVVVLRFVAPHAKRPFKAPAGVLVGLIGFGLCVYMMTGLGLPTWIRYIVWFAIGSIIYAGYGFRHSLLRRLHEEPKPAPPA